MIDLLVGLQGDSFDPDRVVGLVAREDRRTCQCRVKRVDCGQSIIDVFRGLKHDVLVEIGRGELEDCERGLLAVEREAVSEQEQLERQRPFSRTKQLRERVEQLSLFVNQLTDTQPERFSFFLISLFLTHIRYVD